MKKIYSNLKKGEIKLEITNNDDLWCLSQVIDDGDLVKGVTVRKIKIGGGEEGGSETIKKTVFIMLKVEKAEFHSYQNSLRISGKVLEAPEDIPKGSYHTFNVEQDSIITIIKERWLKYQLDRLQEAIEDPSKALICVFDREEAYFALLKKYKYEILLELKGTVQKKDDPSKVTSNFYAQIISYLKEYSERYELNIIILASPAFWKEYLLEELKDEDLKKKIILATCSSATINAVEEVIKRDEVKQILKKDRMAKETRIVEELFKEIAKDNLAVYGFEEVEQAVEVGAVKILLIADSTILKYRQEEKYYSLEKVMKKTEQTGAEVIIISAEHEAGKRLMGLGGIAGLLRYKLSYG